LVLVLGFVNYTVEMRLCALIHIPSFIKFGSTIQKLILGDGYTHRQEIDFISLFLFFQNKDSMLEIRYYVPRRGHTVDRSVM
jgi:hypothetical protein